MPGAQIHTASPTDMTNEPTVLRMAGEMISTPNIPKSICLYVWSFINIHIPDEHILASSECLYVNMYTFVS